MNTGINYRYYLEYGKNGYLIRHKPGSIQRYDELSKKWVDDIEMSQIYFGDIDVNRITEEEANRIITERE